MPLFTEFIINEKPYEKDAFVNNLLDDEEDDWDDWDEEDDLSIIDTEDL